MSGRLIPAHAGKTQNWIDKVNDAGAHPRSRGENLDENGKPRKKRGSSPLTRGKRLAHRLRRLGSRLIPAHAGKTASTAASPGGPTAHPRSRGENIGDASAWRPQVGSSPLTRGKPA